MAVGTVRSVLVGSVIALLIFATVPLAQVAARRSATPHPAAAKSSHAVVDRIGAGVTNFVDMHTRVSVALSKAAR